jgi:hypothetical protein
MREARDEAQRLHNRDRVRQLDRQIELANRTIDGKGRALRLLALGPGGADQPKYAVKFAIEDDLGRVVAQFAFNLFPASVPALVLHDEGHPVPPVEAPTDHGEDRVQIAARPPRGAAVAGV